MGKFKKCVKCNRIKALHDFHSNKTFDDGLNPRCKHCVNTYARERYLNNPNVRRRTAEIRAANLKGKDKAKNQYVRDWYDSAKGRAKTLMKGAERRSYKYNEKLDFDFTFLLHKIENGFCEVTGIPFLMSDRKYSRKNPYSPSIDRIDPRKGYIKSNVRMVIWQFNLMKGEIEDSELLEICKVVVKMMENKGNV